MLLTAMLVSTTLAQSVPGTWTGYVNGWVSEPQRSSNVYLPGPVRRVSQADRQTIILSQIAAQQAYFAQMNLVERQKELAHQQEVDALAAQQRVTAQQEALLAQQQAAAAQSLAQQQQLIAQQQQLLAQQRQLEIDAAQARAEADRVAALEAEQKARADEATRALEARELARSQPRSTEKGPDIHSWTDEDGVVHFSTKPRASSPR